MAAIVLLAYLALFMSFSAVRDVVCLKSIMNPSETVAKGIIQSIDPSKEVGGKSLGRIGANGALGGFAAAYPFLEELRLKRMTVSDESLEFIATSFLCLSLCRC
ncbi:hypothetical protein RJ640_015032 [Escallonia rubra]|uniref:Uncharacterized protein n=1 Tax=Escallonia rubra TaxID=112253 RepID=A0AA88UJS9_9ASTE|nr:hypothetical protein RJ640_015032 [Escallonia rubra]